MVDSYHTFVSADAATLCATSGRCTDRLLLDILYDIFYAYTLGDAKAALLIRFWVAVARDAFRKVFVERSDCLVLNPLHINSVVIMQFCIRFVLYIEEA